MINALGTGVLGVRNGTLTSGGATVSIGLQFVVGDGVHAATFYLNGSVNYFHDGLRIKSNAVLHTCGTITGGSIVVDPGGQRICQ